MAKADPGSVTEVVDLVDADTIRVRARLTLNDGTSGDFERIVTRGDSDFDRYDRELSA